MYMEGDNMKLHSLRIEGFRRHINTEIIFSDTTFLIGPNNVGKSSVLKALDYLLNDKKKMSENDFFCILNEENVNEQVASTVRITAEFRNVPLEAEKWKGFNKHRLFTYDVPEGKNETGIRVFYRKTYKPGEQCIIEMKQFKVKLKTNFENCKTVQDYIDAGLNEDVASKIFEGRERNQTVTKKMLEELEDWAPEELFDTDRSEEIWFENPGGIPGNVISRLPKFLLIPDRAKTEELSSDKGALVKTLNSLFEDIRDSSENFRKAQYYLEELAKELDPKDEDSEFSKMLKELNKVVGDVFPEASFHAQANLSNPNEVIHPKFDIQLGSNVNTDVENQGAGVIRSAIFAMLRYRSMRENRLKRQSNEYVRPLLIAFEEPEIYLHPKAAQQMRDTIYELSSDPNNQIVATTHSPYMIDLSKNSSQVLNSLYIKKETINHKGKLLQIDKVYANPFNVSEAFQKLIQDDRTYVKMLLKLDDSIAKVFFAQHVLIIEGDTEEIVIKETISRMPEELRKEFSYNWEIVKARGKATIVSLVKYLKALGINPYVIHDKDSDNDRAFRINDSILEALEEPNKRIMLENCIEDILGYGPVTNDKPFKAYKYINENWGDDWSCVTPAWKAIFESLVLYSNEISNEVMKEVATERET
jgi:putative ATP-dependent endonuclease of the OLD family